MEVLARLLVVVEGGRGRKEEEEEEEVVVLAANLNSDVDTGRRRGGCKVEQRQGIFAAGEKGGG